MKVGTTVISRFKVGVLTRIAVKGDSGGKTLC